MKLVVLASCLALFASYAHADYVCQVDLAGPGINPTHGTAGEILLVTTPQQNCGGAGKMFFICSKGATDTVCGVHQLSEITLSSLYVSIHDAQMKQQVTWPQADLCNGGGNSYACTGGVMFHGP